MILAGLEGTNRAVATENGQPVEPRLVRAAHEFEAQMMKELLEPMTRRPTWDQGGGEESGILGDFASESLAGALSAKGGIGIGDQILHELSHSGNRSANSPVIENTQMNTGMSARK